MARTRLNVAAAQWSANGAGLGAPDLTVAGSEIFGENTFSQAEQRKRLPKPVFRALQRTIAHGELLDPTLADAVASAMKDWALENGATHYTHWFQPLTGSTAEKHDSFFAPVGDGTAMAEFSGKELIQGEPDASSFPTGGIRATFEARGYTAWDPTSPAFILENPNGSVLCIPTAFTSWTGEALDHKIPLLRSMDALSKSALRALRLFGDTTSQRVFTTIGPEQEYFLIDEHYYYERPDLITTGRTLFGAKPPKGHELDDHYFGSIPERVLACMLETERELAKLGVPIKTRHNEVAPAQYEIAPIFENSNVGSDHQQLCMQVMQAVARRYDLVCLLHEKPFAGVNGSGKHNNWSMGTDDGAQPARARRHAARTTGSSSSSAPRSSRPSTRTRACCGRRSPAPARTSAWEPTRRRRRSSRSSWARSWTACSTPWPRDAWRRPRRAPSSASARRCCRRCRCTAGTATAPARSPSPATSSSSGPWARASRPSFPNTVLNTIVAEAIDDLCEDIENAMRPKGRAKGKSLQDVLPGVLAASFKANRQIIFGGDNYAEAWHREATGRRKLLDLRTTPDALPYLLKPDSVAAFSNYGVLSEREIHARYDVLLEQYVTMINIEAETAASIARTMLLPASVRHLAELKEAGVEELVEETEALRRRLHRRRSGRSRPSTPPTPRTPTCWPTPSTCATACSRR